MRYFSTRGDGKELSFEETVLTGLAPDGGLYIPIEIPKLPDDWQTKWSSFSFQELSLEILSLYIDPSEISRDELRKLVDKSYSTFRHPDVTPLKKLSDDLFVLELFHGPTFAFKDVALQLLGNLFEFFLLRRNARKKAGEPRERLTVLGATSGDTGSAAIYGLRNKADISIFILHPKGRVSPIQEAQMTTVTDDNVHNVAVKGTFDDCQDIVKALFADGEFNSTHHLGAINSINWARILAQTVYYFLAFFHARRLLSAGSSAELQFVVPTGNFGDILAGYYAKRMGLPCARLAVATNENDILVRFWKNGRYEKSASVSAEGAAAPANGASDGRQAAQTGGVRATLSPAMDILVSSNFERLLWYLAFEAIGAKDRKVACATVANWMSKVKSNGRVEVPTGVLELARRDFIAERISDKQTTETIRSFYKSSPSYIVDPHTAVGLAAAKIIATRNPPSTLQIVLSTAHPAKFSEAVTAALADEAGFNFGRDVLPEEFKGLLERKRRVIDVEKPDVSLVKAVIENEAQEKGGKVSSQIGTNLQALIDAQNTPSLPNSSIVLVVSNRKAAYGLTRAANASPPIATAYLALQPYLKSNPGKTRADYDAEIAKIVLDARPDLVVLAGWMHVLSEAFLDPVEEAARVRGKPIPVINLHPALPGAFEGANAIKREYDAFQKGEVDKVGVMVHRVIKEVDRGEPVIVKEVPLEKGETLEVFGERLHKTEWEVLVQGASKVLEEVQ
ncbi:tryptophan synthase beta subunit-like PLP-dependent enzyme [Sanghuangporus baumii]|uniref:threonine synthase n=1 Tax=Sanghuangporus baumii TaxID=108892 RepID=A0A9Q5HZD6_SANBA|nr:tryptophan synthase beta subunit-like PLP-dependent enzyme [Sanghuangporus baumii]